jgi:histone arginine demethylase JMJD6
VSDYVVPKYFPDDLFRLVGEDKRPPYRWFLIGPVRSGTTCHIDPLGTSAWNTLLYGRKRWILFPPGTSKELVKGRAPGIRLKGEDDEPVVCDVLPPLPCCLSRSLVCQDYFVNMVPRIKSTGVSGVIEFVQEPGLGRPYRNCLSFLFGMVFGWSAGETVFVPGGWWHAVLNIEDTVAVTQNFCSTVNFPVVSGFATYSASQGVSVSVVQVWRETRTGRPKMALTWRDRLATSYPVLYRTAKEWVL